MAIIAVAGLTLLLIGLLTVLTLERKTARSYSDAARADLAVESGLAVALGSLMEIAKRDDSLVFRIEDPVQPQVPTPDRPLGYREQFFTYGAIYNNGLWNAIPLFSGANEISLGARELDASLLETQLRTYLGSDAPKLEVDIPNPVFSLPRITAHDQHIPRAKWMEVVPNSGSKDYIMRFAFWVEDLSGRIDGRIAGSEPRKDGLSTSELPLYTFFGETPDARQAALIDKQTSIKTPATVRSLLNEEEAAGVEPYIYYGFPTIDPAMPGPPDTIPYGFGYVKEGEEAPDLNALVASSDVSAIAGQIRDNLPNFEFTRRGGFPNTDNYVDTLAASIVDYADVDSNPTVGSGYRGVDSYPFVNQITDRYMVLPPPSSNPRLIRVRCQTFVELWNPSNQTISGRVQLENVNNVGITAGGQRYMTPRTLRTHPVLAPLTLAPNEHKVIEMFNDGTPGQAAVYEWSSGVQTVSPYLLSGSTTNNYKLNWNNILVDEARNSPGLRRAQGGASVRDSETNAYASGNCPELEPSEGVFGDPRATWYLSRVIRTLNYEANTCWGGRNLLSNISKPMLVSPVVGGSQPGWPDLGPNSPLGQNPGNRANIPAPDGIRRADTGALVPNKSYPPNRPHMAPAKISNIGYYNSLAELGNIYDPAQWRDVDNSTSAADPAAGGGFSLAIGRPEYMRFDAEGKRSAQLLDLFSLKKASASPAIPPYREININTASREALRALMASVILDSDTNISPPLKPPQASQIGDLFADGVIASRNKSPLRSRSDLNRIRINGTGQPFFGNPLVYPEASRPPASWKDSGREELFAKVLNLVTFQGKTFRVVVTGQVVSRTGQIAARSRREFHVNIEPARNPDGSADPNSPPIITRILEREI